MNIEKSFDIPSAVRSVREGDELAFSKLYKFFSPKVLNTSRKMNLSVEDAEEVVQEVFLIIWKTRQGLNPELSFNAYLLTILKSLIIKKVKKQARRIASELYSLTYTQVESNETERSIEYHELEEISYREIEKLPNAQKEVFKMKNFENLHAGEISEKLGISKRTVENHIYTATKSIKQKLQNKYLISIKSLVMGFLIYFF